MATLSSITAVTPSLLTIATFSSTPTVTLLWLRSAHQSSLIFPWLRSAQHRSPLYSPLTRPCSARHQPPRKRHLLGRLASIISKQIFPRQKIVVVLGRPASIISKQIFPGQKTVVVRCEETDISRSLHNKVCTPPSNSLTSSFTHMTLQVVPPQFPTQTSHCQSRQVWSLPPPHSVQDCTRYCGLRATQLF